MDMSQALESKAAMEGPGHHCQGQGADGDLDRCLGFPGEFAQITPKSPATGHRRSQNVAAAPMGAPM